MPIKDFNQVFSERLRFYLDKFQLSQLDLAKKLDVSAASVSDWCNGRKTPRMSKVDAMCNIFHCRRSDLTEEANEDDYYINPETAKVAQEVFENPEMRVLFDAARGSRPEDIQMAADMLKRFKETNKDG